MTTLLFVAIVWRKTLGAFAAWLAVVLIALLGENIDMGHDLLSLGSWHWKASAKDLFHTLFWPTILLLYTRFCRPGQRS